MMCHLYLSRYALFNYMYAHIVVTNELHLNKKKISYFCHAVCEFLIHVNSSRSKYEIDFVRHFVSNIVIHNLFSNIMLSTISTTYIVDQFCFLLYSYYEALLTHMIKSHYKVFTFVYLNY